MTIRVQKHNDGLSLVLPSAITDQTDLTANAEVEVTCEGGAVVVRSVSKPRLTLDELLRRVTDDNKHEETDTGPAVGREVW